MADDTQGISWEEGQTPVAPVPAGGISWEEGRFPTAEEPPSVAGVAARAAPMGVAPAAGGFAGMVAGARAGAAGGAIAGALIPGLGETGIGEAGGALIGGLGGAFIGSGIAEKAQQAILDLIPDSVREAIGQSKSQQEADKLAHPYVSMIARLAPNLALMRPGAIVKTAELGGSALARALASPVGARAVGAGLMGTVEAGQEYAETGTVDPLKVAIAGGAGALMTHETALGRGIRARIEGVPARGLPNVNGVMAAPNVDEAIRAASTAADQHPDMEAMAREALEPEKEETTPTDIPPPGEAAPHREFFGGLNRNTIEQGEDGAWAFKTTDAAGEETAAPLKVWDEAKAAPDEATIPPELAAAQRAHYAKLGIDVVYFRDDPAIPFDGAVDPKRPDTIFLSNNPTRNAEQIGAHELTHVLESTQLPDGTSLGDLLHQQIREGITQEGRRHAVAMFGATAPDRAGFEAGPAGDANHADAVVAHFVRELGADIGGEAPKFADFAPRIVNAVEQRFGPEVGQSVLQKFIAGIKTALDTMRQFFVRGPAETVSQNWVTNLSDIHDTLAKMYAEKYGTQLERAQPAAVAPAARAEPVTEPAAQPAVVPAQPPVVPQAQGIKPAVEPAAAVPSMTETTTLQGRLRTPRRPPSFSVENPVITNIIALGGIKVKDAAGNVTKEGQDIMAVLKDYKRPMLINNRIGKPPGEILAAFKADGWFGPRADKGVDLDDLYDLISEERFTGRAYHPQSEAAIAAQAHRVTDENADHLEDVKDIATKLGITIEPTWDAYEIQASIDERMAMQADRAELPALADELQSRLEAEDDRIPFMEETAEHAPGARELREGEAAPREDQGEDVRSEAVPGAEAAGAGANTERAGAGENLHPAVGALRTEPGAEGLPQTIIPGAEASARQLAAAREAKGHGKIAPKAEQKAAGGLFDEGAAKQEPLLFSPKREPEKPFYSGLERGVKAVNLDKASPGQWLATIRNMPGIKGEERQWSGLEDWLKTATKPVTKGEVLDHLRENEVQVKEVVKGTPATRTPSRQLDEHARALAERDGESWDQLGPNGRQRYQTRAAQELDRGGTKFSQYTLPGGENYRELLLTLPDKIETRARELAAKENKAPWEELGGAGQEHYLRDARRELAPNMGPAGWAEAGNARSRAGDINFRSGHFEEPNVLAHVRFDDRTGPNGEKILHVAEVQSDWHQKGRREGYSTEKPKVIPSIKGADLRVDEGAHSWWVSAPDGRRFEVGKGTVDGEAGAREYGERYLNNEAHRANLEADRAASRKVPNAPFKQSWHELAMKRALRYAAENGYDRLSWDTGETQNARYDLSKQVDAIRYIKQKDGTVVIMGERGGTNIFHEGVAPDKVADYVGKDLADKIAKDEGTEIGNGFRSFSGIDLKVGGPGQKGFYDKILPDFMNKYAKKWGAKVEDGQIETDKYAPYSVVRNGEHWAIVDKHGAMADNVADEATAQGVVDELNRSQERAPIHSIPITPAMRESVMEGQPLFSPKITGAEHEKEAYTPEQLRAYEHVGRITNPPTVRERIDAARQDMRKRFIRYWLDPYIGVKKYDPMGYLALRNANTSTGAFEMFLRHGTLKFTGNAYDILANNGGIEHHLIRPLHGEETRFIWWVAANRAERLTAEERENLWSADDIKAIKTTNQGTTAFDYQLPNGKVTRNREAIYLDSLRKLDTFNKNTLDLAVSAGLLSRKNVSALWSNPFYVPFYRQAAEDGRFVGPTPSKQFVKQSAFKTLKGGTEKLNHDLWENAFGNWAHMIDASFRNLAARRVLEVAALPQNGSAVEVPEAQFKLMSKAEKKITPWVMKDGQKQYFQISDPFLHTAIAALDFSGYKNPIMKSAGWFKKMLTIGVTSNPGFMLRVTIRDTEQAIATAPMSYNFLNNIRTGFAMNDLPGAMQNVARAIAGQEQVRLHLSDEAASAIAGGAVMRLGSGQETGIRKTDLNTMLSTPADINAFWNHISKIARAYKEVSAQSEDVNRFALYHKLIAEGIPHDMAVFAGRDLEDFTLKGAGMAARILTQTVPFLNAWAQGLYKVVRASANADKNIAGAVAGRLAASTARRVGIVLSVTTLLNLGLDALYKDDEDYKKRTETDRNSNYWFKFGPIQVRIPMGFEIAALARAAAIGIEAFYDKEMTPRRVINNVESIAMTNMAMNPIPQEAAPLVDIFRNQTGTGAPIERMGFENMQPEERYNINSTLAARGLSTVGNQAARAIAGQQAQFFSPVQLDYLTNAYFGWLGSTIAWTADLFVRSLSHEPVRPTVDLWNRYTGGMISTQTTQQSRYVDLLYQQADGINRAYGTYEDMINRGRYGEAKDFFVANKDAMIKHGLIGGITTLEGEMNREIRRVENRTDLSAEQKRIQIMKLSAIKNRSAENVFGAH
jgi:conjugative element/phage-associated large polyvalent protein